MRYFITLNYDGTRYHGWQIQPNGLSVQEKLQWGLSTILRNDGLQVTGAGRTDAGVHARMMVAHFDVESLPMAPDDLVYKLNRLLPQDIAIQAIRPVAPEMHARFSATSRTYYYYVHTHKDPFLRHYSCEIHYPLDFQLMNRAAALLLQHEDFQAFCKSHADVKTTICHITRAQWVQIAPTQWRFEITANRFLRNMVRAVVGTLIDVGRKRITVDDFQKVIQLRKRTNAGESMPPNALFLQDIQYDNSQFTIQN
jgi:tRNA pseudouridine38-40 synthase